MKKITIAIDGYSSCGKSTLAKQLAKELGYAFVDTGAMYRAATCYFIRKNLTQEKVLQSLPEVLNEIHISFRFNNEKGLSEVFLNNENVESEIRKMEVSEKVSHFSTIKELRAKLVHLQQLMGKDKGVVMDGRDIGTVVFPHAELKIFMKADPNVRAERRYKELLSKGISVSLKEIKENLESRDYEDTHRTESPLVQAADAFVLDNSLLNESEQFNLVLKMVNERIAAI